MLGHKREVDPDYPGICVIANAIVADAATPEPRSRNIVDRFFDWFIHERLPEWRR